MKKLLLTLMVLLSAAFVFTGCKDTTDATKVSFLDGSWVNKNEDGSYYNKIEIEDMKYKLFETTNDYGIAFDNYKEQDKPLPEVKWEIIPRGKGNVYLEKNILFLEEEVFDIVNVTKCKLSDDKKSFSITYGDLERKYIKE